MKRKKIKWSNVIKLLIFLFSISVIIQKICILTFYSWSTGTVYGLTWYGLLILVLFYSIAAMIYQDFKRQIAKTPATGNSQRLKNV